MCVSVIVLTKNEQKDLPGCLDSVSWSDDVHVYDSFSTDETIDIARKYGALVIQRKFDNWAAHQNWGLKNIQFKYPWVLYLDADERVTPDLQRQILLVVKKPEKYSAFRIQRRDFFLGKWLKHVQATPFYIRLFRPERMRYERLVNPISIVEGDVGDVSGYLDHFPFSKGIGHWIERHNSYSTFEAQQIFENKKNEEKFSLKKAFFEADFHKRRFHQKELFYRIPARPLLKFLIIYIFKRGFLDGKAGFVYSVLQSIYEYFIVLKSRELNG